MYRDWSFLLSMGVLSLKWQKMTKPNTYSESARRASLTELYGRDALDTEFLTAYLLIIKSLSRILDHIIWSILYHLFYHNTSYLVCESIKINNRLRC